jgi:hypothetical protein
MQDDDFDGNVYMVRPLVQQWSAKESWAYFTFAWNRRQAGGSEFCGGRNSDSGLLPGDPCAALTGCDQPLGRGRPTWRRSGLAMRRGPVPNLCRLGRGLAVGAAAQLIHENAIHQACLIVFVSLMIERAFGRSRSCSLRYQARWGI